jgi:putative tryptophan/tyrosine transport system substrate-binding protein
MSNSTSRRTFLKQASLLSFVPSILFRNDILKNRTIPAIGFLLGAGYSEMDTSFTDEFKKLGFIEGQNITIERRFAKPNSSDGATMAAELAQMDLSLIVVGALPFALEVRKNNPKMPMVIATCPGMVSNGFAESMEHPGGIYTGMDELPAGVTTKRVQLLKEAAPNVTRIALLSTTPGTGGHETQLSEAEKIAATLAIEVKPYRASSLQQLEKALKDLTNDGMNGLLSFQGGLSLANRKLIVDHAEQYKIPAIYQATLFAEAGGLMSWAPDLLLQYREAAHYVSRILKGAKPGDLPVKHPEKYYLTLNTTAAKKIDLTFPENILAQASRVLF